MIKENNIAKEWLSNADMLTSFTLYAKNMLSLLLL